MNGRIGVARIAAARHRRRDARGRFCKAPARERLAARLPSRAGMIRAACHALTALVIVVLPLLAVLHAL